MYSYVRDNPLTYIDPTGMNVFEDSWDKNLDHFVVPENAASNQAQQARQLAMFGAVVGDYFLMRRKQFHTQRCRATFIFLSVLRRRSRQFWDEVQYFATSIDWIVCGLAPVGAEGRVPEVRLGLY
ncbi:MAG: hypothetical protein JO022_08765 [Acidobacteriaceae bacterium]|nr:hypothetical protein [Acidobacteriaceae bacterium]